MIHGQQRHRAKRPVSRARGFSLIELMIAMLLGLIVIAGVSSVFLAGQQTYRTNEALGDVQDGSRTAFELLSRDIRNAGLTGCDDTNGRIANVLNPVNGSTPWYANWGYAVQGFDDATTDPALTSITGTGAPVKGSSSIELLSTASSDVVVTWNTSQGNGSPGNFKINVSSTDLATGSIIMVCDFDHATILQITKYAGDTIVVHNDGSSVTPGNCTKGMGYPVVCSSNGNNWNFANNGRVAVLTAVDWYIGTNPLKGKSLYRLSVNYSGTGATSTPVEMVRNVTGMQINYLQSSSTPPVGLMQGALPGSSFVNAATVAANGNNWGNVYAAQVTLTVQSTVQNNVQSTNSPVNAANATVLSRQFTSTTTVRNRTP